MLQANALQRPEQLDKTMLIRVGQGRAAQRFDIPLEMIEVAGAEQCHVDPRLMTAKSVGRLDDVAGAIGMDQKSQRVLFRRQPIRHLTPLGKLSESRLQPAGK